MKYAIADGKKTEATPRAKGLCQGCESELVPKCGNIKVWHWAHKAKTQCDRWWENETEWHRAWKEQFPDDWQEVVLLAESGEKHIADVKTDQGWVLEFQHSFLKPEERQAREAFYPKLVWIVDGVKRKRDKFHFFNAWQKSIEVSAQAWLVRRVFSDECVLLREWADSRVPIFFDFGEGNVLWWLTKGSDGRVYIAQFQRDDFIKSHRDGASQMSREFDEFVKDISKLVADYEAPPQAQASISQPQPPPAQVSISQPPQQPQWRPQDYLTNWARRQKRRL